MGNKSIGESMENLADETARNFTGKAKEDIAAIYESLEDMDPPVRDLILDSGDSDIRHDFLHRLFTSERFAFRKYCEDPDNGTYAEAYLGSILNIYDGYKRCPPEGMDINGLTEATTELFKHGINGIKRRE